jgi:hypothetical protein
LDKLDRYTCLKESGVIIPAEGESDSSDDDDEDDEDASEEGTDDDPTLPDDDVEVPLDNEAITDEVIDRDEAEGDQKVGEKTQQEKARPTDMRRLFFDICHFSGCTPVNG